MSKEQDRQFMNTFAVVIGVLVAIAVIILILANTISSRHVDTSREPAAQEQVVERIRPVGDVAVAGAAAPGEAEARPVAAAADDLGKKTYDQACFACHGAGVAGAPRIGDTDDWTARLEQGRDVLIQHSIEGFMGDKGFMPPKGGAAHLSDEAVIAALDYMLEESR